MTIAMPVSALGDSDFDIIVQVWGYDSYDITDCLPDDGVASVHGPPVVRFGDVNCNGAVNAEDVRDILEHAGGIDGEPASDCSAVGDESEYVYGAGEPAAGINGDVNCDGAADAWDALYLLRDLGGSAEAISGCPEPGTPPIQ
jgi:hypothetical protein